MKRNFRISSGCNLWIGEQLIALYSWYDFSSVEYDRRRRVLLRFVSVPEASDRDDCPPIFFRFSGVTRFEIRGTLISEFPGEIEEVGYTNKGVEDDELLFMNDGDPKLVGEYSFALRLWSGTIFISAEEAEVEICRSDEGQATLAPED